jgi:hypothetical protein
VLSGHGEGLRATHALLPPPTHRHSDRSTRQFADAVVCVNQIRGGSNVVKVADQVPVHVSSQTQGPLQLGGMHLALSPVGFNEKLVSDCNSGADASSKNAHPNALVSWSGGVDEAV